MQYAHIYTIAEEPMNIDIEAIGPRVSTDIGAPSDHPKWRHAEYPVIEYNNIDDWITATEGLDRIYAIDGWVYEGDKAMQEINKHLV